MKKPPSPVLLLCLSLLSVSVLVSAASADPAGVAGEAIVVTTLSDEVDPSGLSLREAIAQARAREGAQRVGFAAPLRGEIALRAPLHVRDDAALTIVMGDALRVAAAPGARLLVKEGAGALTVQGARMVGGEVVGSAGGACVDAREGALILAGVTLSDCEAPGTPAMPGGALRAAPGVRLEAHQTRWHEARLRGAGEARPWRAPRARAAR